MPYDYAAMQDELEERQRCNGCDYQCWYGTVKVCYDCANGPVAGTRNNHSKHAEERRGDQRG